MKRRLALLWFIAIGAASATPALRVLGHDCEPRRVRARYFAPESILSLSTLRCVVEDVP